MTSFVVCHGAWGGAWSWVRVSRPLVERGHDLTVPTYTGLGERAHLASPKVDLDTHIEDVRQLLDKEDVRDAVLVGHSYGGMVATGVADRAGDRVAALIYLDAFVPEDGQCVFDFHDAAAVEDMRAAARGAGDGWRVLPGPLAPDTRPEDVGWLTANCRPQPLATFEQRLSLTQPPRPLPRSYIYCRTKGSRDPFRAVADRVKVTPGWHYYELDCGHTPNVTMPETLAALLDRIVSGDG